MNIWFRNVNTNGCKLEGSFRTWRRKWDAYRSCIPARPYNLKHHFLLVCCSRTIYCLSADGPAPIAMSHHAERKKYGRVTVQCHHLAHRVFSQCRPSFHPSSPSTHPDIRDGTAPAQADSHPRASYPLGYPLITCKICNLDLNVTEELRYVQSNRSYFKTRFNFNTWSSLLGNEMEIIIRQ